MLIREVLKDDLLDLLQLYTQLHDNQMPSQDSQLATIWEKIMADDNHHILAGFVGGKLIASCVIVVIPNLTRKQQPYALIENVITDIAYRKKGYGTQLLEAAAEIAKAANCYKIMLLTGAKEESTLNFYQKAGYNQQDKTAFIQWL
ncbi:GNAT superfamily N-acetyltransferase [Enterococcus sp. PF1-24]|uniref:GNAT family N-acetyltransferase n=1 Tax=unclassified Enterococcus TaxID=2608891 RepID=UPI00247C4424|nr:GNAT superfamily N-acetyltransferase [Enterococcus sp. PFB1-1]MDH6402259.1 GNAT superfamily N-acetyltransferase [Enterococcus sp. PF1-24]